MFLLPSTLSSQSFFPPWCALTPPCSSSLQRCPPNPSSHPGVHSLHHVPPPFNAVLPILLPTLVCTHSTMFLLPSTLSSQSFFPPWCALTIVMFLLPSTLSSQSFFPPWCALTPPCSSSLQRCPPNPSSHPGVHSLHHVPPPFNADLPILLPTLVCTHSTMFLLPSTLSSQSFFPPWCALTPPCSSSLQRCPPNPSSHPGVHSLHHVPPPFNAVLPILLPTLVCTHSIMFLLPSTLTSQSFFPPWCALTPPCSSSLQRCPPNPSSHPGVHSLHHVPPPFNAVLLILLPTLVCTHSTMFLLPSTLSSQSFFPPWCALTPPCSSSLQRCPPNPSSHPGVHSLHHVPPPFNAVLPILLPTLVCTHSTMFLLPSTLSSQSFFPPWCALTPPCSSSLQRCPPNPSSHPGVHSP
ncbi:uncharacterized protein LOC133633447 [Entelurus aequoreus]|uniref:uncharacterized protein LOC133633447 n=1 Tax=Entelurus aequoreus TaxID=161455 RepID=UPI002B1E2D62|nr:uncharacterized protein LOC133633447 [Entelurus aequoreus]